jgi:hypothetical protein
LNIDDNIQVYYYDNNAYYGDNILRFKIQFTSLDSNYNGIDDFDKYFTYIDAGQIKNGKLLLFYNIIDEKYCNDIKDELGLPKYLKINISNNEAKIKIINPYNIDVFNHENKNIGFLRFENYDCAGKIFRSYHSGPCSTIYFIYATEDTKITIKYDTEIYDLNLMKGWNKVYYYEQNILLRRVNTTNSKKFPTSVMWRIVMLK